MLTKEDKILLIKDIGGRLAYGVRGKFVDGIDEAEAPFDPLVDNLKINYKNPQSWFDGSIKPYLYPISKVRDIIKEHEAEWDEIIAIQLAELEDNNPVALSVSKEIEFYNKYHIDFRGLIPRGLAIDCSNMNNIY